MDLDDLLSAIEAPSGKQQRWVAMYQGVGSDALNDKNVRQFFDTGWTLRPPESVTDELRKHYENVYHPDYGEGLRLNELVLMWREAQAPPDIRQQDLLEAAVGEENEAVDQWMLRQHRERWEDYKEKHPDWESQGVFTQVLDVKIPNKKR